MRRDYAHHRGPVNTNWLARAFGFGLAMPIRRQSWRPSHPDLIAIKDAAYAAFPPAQNRAGGAANKAHLFRRGAPIEQAR